MQQKSVVIFTSAQMHRVPCRHVSMRKEKKKTLSASLSANDSAQLPVGACEILTGHFKWLGDVDEDISGSRAPATKRDIILTPEKELIEHIRQRAAEISIPFKMLIHADVHINTANSMTPSSKVHYPRELI